MIAYINGEVTYIGDGIIFLENNGIGYQIAMPQSSLFKLDTNLSVKVYTYMAVKEDDVSLYGFLTVDELEMFKMLLTVSGVGPKGALGILSSISTDSLKMAIAAEDAKLIASSKGIGAKTAQKIVVELKGKVDKSFAVTGAAQNTSSKTDPAVSSIVSEAIDGLEILGFSRSAVIKAINTISVTPDMDASNLVTEVLKVIE